MEVHFQSTVSYPTAETYVSFSGSSYAKWYGISPYNATSVRLVDHFHADGLQIQVSFPSGGVYGSGSDAYWDDTNAPDWRNIHNFTNVKFSGLIIYGVTETVSGYFKFGSTSWNLNADDGALV